MVATVERTWVKKDRKNPARSLSHGQSLDAVGALSFVARFKEFSSG